MAIGAIDLREAEPQRRLAGFVARAAGAESVTVLGTAPLRGGAIQENWAVDLAVTGGPAAGRQALVLRTDAPSRVALSHGRAEEFALLRLAWLAGVTVPEPLWLCRDPTVLGRDFYLMRRARGTAAGHRIVRDPGVGGDRERLARRLGDELARLHAVTPATIHRYDAALAAEILSFLHPPATAPALAQVAAYRGCLDAMSVPHPVLELGLRWLERRAPPTGTIVLLHQDFRTGNYMVDADGLTAILDWEFCAWGDPLADIGWFCAKCWRYGAVEKEAGGIADRRPFYEAYEQRSGCRIDPTAVRYWEVMAHLRWAVIALQQAERFLARGEPSLELALTGRLLPELEWEILRLMETQDDRPAAA